MRNETIELLQSHRLIRKFTNQTILIFFKGDMSVNQ